MKKKAWDTAVDVQQLLFLENARVYPPAPPPGYIPASPTRELKKSPGQVTWPPHLQGITDSWEPLRLVFSMSKIQVSWFILKIGTGWKCRRTGSCCGHGVAAGLWKGGSKALLLSPLHTFHSHLTGLPGFRIQAPLFSVGRIVENTFFI